MDEVRSLLLLRSRWRNLLESRVVDLAQARHPIDRLRIGYEQDGTSGAKVPWLAAEFT